VRRLEVSGGARETGESFLVNLEEDRMGDVSTAQEKRAEHCGKEVAPVNPVSKNQAEDFPNPNREVVRIRAAFPSSFL
jgi:hypothetical protein